VGCLKKGLSNTLTDLANEKEEVVDVLLKEVTVASVPNILSEDLLHWKEGYIEGEKYGSD